MERTWGDENCIEGREHRSIRGIVECNEGGREFFFRSFNHPQ